MRWLGWLVAAFLFLGIMSSPTASASPWAEVGDAQLRSDLQVLATAGVIDDITTQWPIPWAGVTSRLLAEDALANQPDFVREAGRRVLERAEQEVQFDELRVGGNIDATNSPNVVRGFDALGLGEGQAQLSLEYMTSTTAARLSVGIFAPTFSGSKKLFMPDGSYVAQKFGGALIYAGYLTHWWGPGWISALNYSNNARPFPQIGIERDGTSASQSPWFSWIGPWQMEFLMGWFNDPRLETNTYWDGFRFTFNPLPGLQIGLSRTQEFCGKGFPCKPLVSLFHILNDPKHPDQSNDEGIIDLQYSRTLRGLPFEIYMQVMNEDTNPFFHSFSSHIFGTSVWVPIRGQNLRVTLEYTDSIATTDIFSFGNVGYGVTYDNFQYLDGMRYRGRALGFSLDSDSRLASLQASLVDAGNRTFTLTLHRAQVSTPFTGAGNPLTPVPVTIDLAEARVSLPWSVAKLDIAARVQDDQLRPARGFTAGIETALSVEF